MSDENQVVVPASFVALFVPPGRLRPTLGREAIAARHEFCDDLASMLAEPANTQKWESGADEAEVLERVRQGLLQPTATGGVPIVSEAEAGWVVGRLAELLEWRFEPPH